MSPSYTRTWVSADRGRHTPRPARPWRLRRRRSAARYRAAQARAVPPIVTPATRSVGCPQPTGTLLAVLAAGAGAHVEVVADGVDLAQSTSGPLPMQIGVADRLGDPAVLDQVGLDHPEDEVAGSGVDLAPAKLRT